MVHGGNNKQLDMIEAMGFCFQGKTVQHQRYVKLAHFPSQKILMPKLYSIAWHSRSIFILNLPFKLFFKSSPSFTELYCFLPVFAQSHSPCLDCHSPANAIHSVYPMLIINWFSWSFVFLKFIHVILTNQFVNLLRGKGQSIMFLIFHLLKGLVQSPECRVQ